MSQSNRPSLDLGEPGDVTAIHRSPTARESTEARIVCYDVDCPQRLDSLMEPDTAVFDSVFETGNLKAAVRVRTYNPSGVSDGRLNDQVYELYLRHDVCYPAETCWWFHFSVTNVVPGIPYEFRIVNMQRKDKFFSKGMHPVVYIASPSTQSTSTCTPTQGWARCGKNVLYHLTPLLPSERIAAMTAVKPPKFDGWRRVKAFIQSRQQAPKLLDIVTAAVAKSKGHPIGSGSGGIHAVPTLVATDHTTAVREPVVIPPPQSLLPSLGIVSDTGGPLTLRFTYTFAHKDDVCYFAPTFPYGHSTLQTFLSTIAGAPTEVHGAVYHHVPLQVDISDSTGTGKSDDGVEEKGVGGSGGSGSLVQAITTTPLHAKRRLSQVLGNELLAMNHKFTLPAPPGIAIYAHTVPHLSPVTRPLVTRNVLCKSVEGHWVEYLIVTSPTSPKHAPYCAPSKPVIAFIGRQHPGEASASFVVEGVLEYLLSGSDVANALLEYFEFQIVPMVNTDGVMNGNYQHSLTGSDYNTVWDDPDATKQPEVYYLKEHFKHLQGGGGGKGGRLLSLVDVHAHSSKPGVFIYGCTGDRAAFDRAKCVHPFGRETCPCCKGSGDDSLMGHDPHALAKSLSRFVPEFSTEASHFTVHASKVGCARAVAWYELRVPLSVTLETSLVGSDAVDFMPEDYRRIGASFCAGLAHYFGVDVSAGTINEAKYCACMTEAMTLGGGGGITVLSPSSKSTGSVTSPQSASRRLTGTTPTNLAYRPPFK